MMAWLKRAWHWLVVALLVVIPVLGWLSERRRRLRAEAAARFERGAVERDAALHETTTAIERRADGARIAVVAATERDAAPLDAAAEAASKLAAEVRADERASAELLAEIARRNNARLDAVRKAAQEPNPW